MSSPPLLLYTGRTVHERRDPAHRFSYRVAMMLIDLNRLNEAARSSALFSLERFNLYSFHRKDHGARDGSSLLDWARARFAEAGIEAETARIRLLCSPRVLGYVFNPISIYFADDGEGRLIGVIYQVHNTFGEAHAYVVPASGQAREQHEADKVFHVSPFFDLEGRYSFVLRQPREAFRLVIHKTRTDGPDFFASMMLKRSRASTARFAGLFASQPFSTLKTIAAIHFEALRLWSKGARFHSRPAPPQKSTRGETTRSHALGRGARPL